MTEFWVSKAKYYCKTCKIWMADNKMSRQMHESSGKHRDLVQREAQLKKDAKLHGARSDAELQRTLAEINKAAHAAVASDRDTGGAAHATMFAASSAIPNKYKHGAPGGDWQSNSIGGGAGGSADHDILRQDDSGTYTVDGVTYLEGARHEALLLTGAAVEVFVDEADSWCPGRIAARRSEPVPHTALVLTAFHVAYRVPRAQLQAVLALPHRSLGAPEAATVVEPGAGSASWESAESKGEDEVWVEEANVKSDRMRLVAGDGLGGADAADAADAAAGTEAQSLTEAAAPRSLLSMSADEYMAAMQAQQRSWQTVSVDVVDESAPPAEAPPDLEEEQAFAGYARGGDKGGSGSGAAVSVNAARTKLAQEIAASIESKDDALSTFDPYGTHCYKGYKLGDDVVTSYERDSAGAAGAEPVAFKKRKRRTGNGTARSSTDSP